MKDCLTIGQAARLTGMTTETLRHYDRIGLITPSRRDEWSGYRYYTRQDIVRLNTVQALRCMELSLQEIQQILACSQLEELIGLLRQAEAKADARLAQLHAARSRIARARQAYESKRSSAQARGGLFVQQLPERIVVLSQEPAEPSLETLWNYLAPFYDQLGAGSRQQYALEDAAGVYRCAESSRLFAICSRYPSLEGLTRIPAGPYLCASCTEEDRMQVLEQMLQAARTQYGAAPSFSLELVILSGVLQWTYQIQLPLLPNAESAPAGHPPRPGA